MLIWRLETGIKEWAASKSNLLLGPTSSEAPFPAGRLQEADLRAGVWWKPDNSAKLRQGEKPAPSLLIVLTKALGSHQVQNLGQDYRTAKRP